MSVLPPTWPSTALCFVFVAALSGCPSVTTVTLDEAVLEDQDLVLGWVKPESRDADDFSEQARLDAVLEGGGQLSVRLLVSNIAKLDGRAELVTRLTLPDGRVFSDSVRRDRGEWEFGADHLRATIGASTLEAKVGWAHAHIKTPDFVLDVEVDSDERALRPRGGGLEFGGTWYRTTIDIPRGRLTGVLRLRGAGPEPEAEDDATDANPPGDGDAPDAGTDTGTDAGSDDGPRAESQADSPRAGSDDGPHAESQADGPHAGTTTAEEPHDGAHGDESAAGADDDRPADEPNGGDPAAGVKPAGEPEAADEDAFGDEIDLEGAAYVEHRATDLAPYRMARRWFKLKEITLERTVIVSIFERTAELGGDLQGFILIADDEGLLAYEPALLVSPRTPHPDPETGYTLPTTLFIRGAGTSTFEGVIRPNALTERRDDLARMKKLERVIVKRFMKPWTFIFGASDYLFRRVDPAAEDGRASWSGQGRFEIQQLNPD